MKTGAAFEAQMKNDYGGQLDERHRLEDERVAAAQASVRGQIVKLKAAMQKVGTRNAEGRLAVPFKVLFESVQGQMATLSGTLKTARRLGVVAFDPKVETLFQGASDAVVIELLDESDKTDYEIVVREKGKKGEKEQRDPFALDKETSKIVNCYRCGEPVMPTDRVGVSGVVLHRGKCFECELDECDIVLTPARYASIVIDGKLKFYCVAHFSQLFKKHADYTRGFRSDKTVEEDPNLSQSKE